MREELADRDGIEQRGDQAQPATAIGTRQNIDGECPVHQSGPGPGGRGGRHSGLARTRADAGTPPATINRETQLLGQAYTLAMRSKPPRVTTKPNIRRLSEKGNVRKEFFEPAEFERVVNALPEYLQDVARFAYLTGWRRGDMLGFGVLQHSGQKTEAPKILKSWGLCGCGG